MSSCGSTTRSSSKSQTREGLDQLAREWHSAVDHYGAHVRVSALIYLTPHLEPPKAALAESAEVLGADASALWWMSWSSLVPILEQQLAGDRSTRTVAADLLAYLTRVGLIRFRGWRLIPGWQRHAGWTYHQSSPVTYWHALVINNRPWSYPR